jgi:hypothetical protein
MLMENKGNSSKAASECLIEKSKPLYFKNEASESLYPKEESESLYLKGK